MSWHWSFWTNDFARGERRQSTGHARTGGGEVRPPGGALSITRESGASRTGNGRQEHSWTVAAGGGKRLDDHHLGRRSRRTGGRRGATDNAMNRISTGCQ